MRHTSLAILALVPILILSLPGALGAQDSEPAAGAPAEDVPAREAVALPAGDEPANSYEVRNRFTSLLRGYPPELTSIFKLDPSLLSNDAFLAEYPEIVRFVEEHPEVRRNPRFFLRDFGVDHEHGALSELLEMMIIFATFLLIAFALAWLVRTVIEQKRWNRLSKTQTEVHNKILDRFGSTDELLEYIRTPAGEGFLESAPIPLHSDRPASSPPLSRALWSIQIGVVLGAAALGMLLVSGQLDEESAQALFVLGVIGLSAGVGFVASAVVSLLLSRRLGLWEPPPGSGTGSGSSSGPGSSDPLDEPGPVR